MIGTPALLTPTLAAIHERRAIRSYSTQAVEHDAIERLLEAAVWAPSAMNAQPWSFVVVEDEATLERVERDSAALYLVDPPPPALAHRSVGERDSIRALVGSGFSILHGAPLLIVIYANGAAEVPDCYLAAENLMLAATTLGLGTCPIGLAVPLFDDPVTKAEFDVPPPCVCALPIVVGHPSADGAPPHREPPRVLAWR